MISVMNLLFKGAGAGCGSAAACPAVSDKELLWVKVHLMLQLLALKDTHKVGHAKHKSATLSTLKGRLRHTRPYLITDLWHVLWSSISNTSPAPHLITYLWHVLWSSTSNTSSAPFPPCLLFCSSAGLALNTDAAKWPPACQQ